MSVKTGSPFVPELGEQYRGKLALLWMGKNDLSYDPATTDSNPPSVVIARTDATFDRLAPLIMRSLVLGYFLNQSVQWTDAETRARIAEVNAAHAARYGDLFLDIQAFMVSPLIWELAEVTPTADDLAYQVDERKPLSLSADNAQFNAAGYLAISRLIYQRLIELGWYEEPTPDVASLPVVDNFDRANGPLAGTYPNSGGVRWVNMEGMYNIQESKAIAANTTSDTVLIETGSAGC
ncbi:hypothetical protein ACX5K5_06105 [Glutamicibacter bergerei]